MTGIAVPSLTIFNSGIVASAVRISSALAKMPELKIVSDGTAIPVIAFTLADERPYTVFDISHELRARGWQVPAYTMPDDATDVAVLRIVVREGFSADLGHLLVESIRDVITELDQIKPQKHSDTSHFAH